MIKHTLSGVSAIAMLVAGAAFAQDQEPAATETPAAEAPSEQMGRSVESFRSYNKSEEFEGAISGGYTAEDLIGREVVDAEGEDVATVSDLAIGPDDRVQQVIMNVGGFLGIGSKTVAIGDEDEIGLNMTEEELENLPSCEESDEGWNIMS